MKANNYMFVFKGNDDFELHTQRYNANYLYVVKELRCESINDFIKNFHRENEYDCVAVFELI